MTTTGSDDDAAAAAGACGAWRAVAGLVSRALARVLAVNLTDASRSVVETVLADVAYLRRWLDGVELRAANRLADLATVTPSIFPEQVIATATRTDLRAGARVVERAATGAQFGAVSRAVDDGRVSSAHVDVLTAALAGLPPHLRPALVAGGDHLAQVAERTTPSGFRRAVADEARRLEADDGVERLTRQKRLVGLRSWLDRDSGMIRLSGQFDPETGLALVGRLEREMETRFHGVTPEHCPIDPGLRNDFLRAHALLALIAPRQVPAVRASLDVAGTHGCGAADACSGPPQDVAKAAGKGAADTVARPNPCQPDRHAQRRAGALLDDDMAVMHTRAEVLLLIDFDTLTTGRHAATRLQSGLPGVELPIETVRRMTCLADIVPIVLNGDGVVVKLGRTVRLANRAQRRALRAMHETCAVPDCAVAFRHCQPHHVSWFRRGGNTDLDNLVPLCSRHHHAVHEGGWTLHLEPTTRRVTVRLPTTGRSEHGAEPP